MQDAARVQVRPARPEDYGPIVAVVDAWWGRPVAAGLPRLFLDHFFSTSLVAEEQGALVGFLVGFASPARPEEAYIHFVGVSPGHRGAGLARELYERFFELARAAGGRRVRAITAPVNQASIAFHRRMGFAVSEPVPDYNGPGRPMVVFERAL